MSFEVKMVDHFRSNDPTKQLYEFIIKGKAFLWHQVRLMVAILFLIGKGLEEPEVFSILFPSLLPLHLKEEVLFLCLNWFCITE